MCFSAWWRSSLEPWNAESLPAKCHIYTRRDDDYDLWLPGSGSDLSKSLGALVLEVLEGGHKASHRIHMLEQALKYMLRIFLPQAYKPLTNNLSKFYNRKQCFDRHAKFLARD